MAADREDPVFPMVKLYVSDDLKDHRPRAHLDMKKFRGNHERSGHCLVVMDPRREEDVPTLSKEEMENL